MDSITSSYVFDRRSNCYPISHPVDPVCLNSYQRRPSGGHAQSRKSAVYLLTTRKLFSNTSFSIFAAVNT